MGGTWTQRADVIVTDLDDELVLLEPASRAIFTLNATGRVVWHGLAGGADLSALTTLVTDRFEIDADTAQADITALLEALARAGLAESA